MTATDGGSPTTGRGTGGRPLGSAYVVYEVIGRGATGEVWNGADRRTGAPVAVKILRSELADDPRIVERFLRERAILSELDAPNIVGLRDLVVEGDTVALVTDLVTGGDLRARLRADGALPPALAVDLVCQILEGLDVAHERGVIHRDLKPENVLLEERTGGRPVVRITDFGIATLAFSNATVTTSIVGSPEYLAPEVIEAGARTPAVDVYSAGIVLYELLAGRTPFAGGPPIAVVRRQVDDPPPRIAGVPVSLWSEVATLLAKDPAQRPSRARTAATRLAELADELDGLPPIGFGRDGAGVVDLVAAEATEARDGDHEGDRDHFAPSENGTTRVRGRHVVHEVVHRAPGVRQPQRRRAWQRVAPFVAAGVVVVGMGAVWLARRDDAAHASGLQYTAAPVVESSGVIVTRTLGLSGAKGDHLTVRLRVDNPTSKRVDKVFERDLRASDHGESVHRVDLAPRDATTVSYTTTVARGDIDHARLVTIEAALDDRPDVTNVLAFADATPDVVHLRPQQRAYLNLSGALRTAPARDADVRRLLSSISWRSSNAHVADVQEAASGEWRPVVVAGHAGRAVLHADVGAQSLDVEVIVSGPAASATDLPCEPGVGDPPGATKIADGTTIVDPATHAFVVAGGARIPIDTKPSAGRPAEYLDQTAVGAISTIPRDGTVFQAGTQYEVVVAGGLANATGQDVAAFHATPVAVDPGWLYLLPPYPFTRPRDGSLVTDFAQKTTMRWHNGAWTATTRACPSAHVARLPRSFPPPAPSAT